MTTAYVRTCNDLEPLAQVDSRAVTLPTRQRRTVEPLRVDSKLIEEALGPLALRLLACLLDDRAAGRTSYRTREGWARRLSATETAVKMALATLRAAGLQNPTGWQRRLVPQGGLGPRGEVVALMWTWVYVRAASDDLLISGGVLRASPALLAWAEEVLRARRNWGGARPNSGGKRVGAGRPRKAEVEARKSASLPPRFVFMSSSDQVPSELAAAEPAARDPQPSNSTPPQLADAGVVRSPTELNPRRRLVELGARLIPPTPDAKMVAEVRTPQPALLPVDPSNDAQILADAYAGAINARWPKFEPAPANPDFCARCFCDHKPVRGACGRLKQIFTLLSSTDPLDRADGEAKMAMQVTSRPPLSLSDVVRQNYEGQLLAAAAHMRAHRVAPAAWCLFSCDVWRDSEITDGPPTLAFVLSAQRLTERLGWFEDERARYAGGTVMLSDELRALAQKHQDMWREILRESPWDRPSLQLIVDRHFPGITYDRMLETARRGQAALQARVDDMVKRGLSLWV